MPLFFQLNAVNAAIFPVNAAIIPVQRWYRRYFSGTTPLTPPFFRLITASVANFDRR